MNANLKHAPHGGLDEYDRHYRAGEFLPFYVPRSAMPQVDEKDQPRMVAAAMGAGIGIAFEVRHVGDVRAHQRVNKHIASSMSEMVKRKPVIVSSDGYILDGNHRWWANVHDGNDWLVAITVDRTFDEARDWLLSQPYVYEINPYTAIRN